jgi:hypothetical protein
MVAWRISNDSTCSGEYMHMYSVSVFRRMSRYAHARNFQYVLTGGAFSAMWSCVFCQQGTCSRHRDQTHQRLFEPPRGSIARSGLRRVLDGMYDGSLCFFDHRKARVAESTGDGRLKYERRAQICLSLQSPRRDSTWAGRNQVWDMRGLDKRVELRKQWQSWAACVANLRIGP